MSQFVSVHNKPPILRMEWHIALRAGYLLPVAAQLGHLDGPMGFGTLHAQSVSAAVGREDWTPIGGVLRRRADIVGLEADAADILVAHAFLALVQIEVNEVACCLPRHRMIFPSIFLLGSSDLHSAFASWVVRRKDEQQKGVQRQ